MLQMLVLYMPEPGSPVAGSLSVMLAITIAFWGPLRRLAHRATHQTVVVEADWKVLLRQRQEEAGAAVTLDEVLLERAKADRYLLLAAEARPRGGEVWFRNPRGQVASLPFDDLRKKAA